MTSDDAMSVSPASPGTVFARRGARRDSDDVLARDLDDQTAEERADALARATWPGATLSRVRRLEGGVSSITFAAVLYRDDAPEQEVVLKFAPPGLQPVRNRDVLRQARVLDQLATLDEFPVPAVLMRDAGQPPAVPPMFAMELRPGQAYEPLLDVSDDPPSAEDVVTRQHELVRALALLQSRTPAQLGVDDEPVSTAADELARWHRLFETVDPDIAVGHEDLAARLRERVPSDIAPRLVHGDYRAANMLFVGPRLEAVIDWEIWSVGDPRTDLAWVLMHTDPSHVFHGHRSEGDVQAGRLMPTSSELLDTFVTASADHGSTRAEVDDATRSLDWFVGVGHYKVAATIAVIWKRERQREQPDPKLVIAAQHLDRVLAAGHAALDSMAP